MTCSSRRRTPLADCGFDGVHPLEPTAGMELAAAKEAVGDRMCLVGNIDISYILVNAPREEVFETVRRAIADAGKGGGSYWRRTTATRTCPSRG